MDPRVGIQLPYTTTMVLPKGIFVKVPHGGRAREHRVHHLQHHQHHLVVGDLFGSAHQELYLSIASEFFDAVDYEAGYGVQKPHVHIY